MGTRERCELAKPITETGICRLQERLAALYAEACADEGELRRVQQRQLLLAGADALALPPWRQARAAQAARLGLGPDGVPASAADRAPKGAGAAAVDAGARPASAPAAGAAPEQQRQPEAAAAEHAERLEGASPAESDADWEPAAAPTGPLRGESEAALAAFCALQDTLSRDEALALAREVRGTVQGWMVQLLQCCALKKASCAGGALRAAACVLES